MPIADIASLIRLPRRQERADWGNFKAEYLCCREIDDELKLGGSHDRQISRFFALENASSIDACLMIGVHSVGAVAHEAAGTGVFGITEDAGKCMAQCKRGDLPSTDEKELISVNENCVGALLNEAGEGRNVALGAGMLNVKPQAECASRHFQAFHDDRSIGIVLVVEQPNDFRRGNQFVEASPAVSAPRRL